MNIIPNFLVVGLQAIPFLITIVALYQIIWKPMLAYLAEREAATEGARAEAAALEEKVAAQLADYEARLAEARTELRQMRSDRRDAALKAYTAQIDAARQAAEERVGAALAELSAEQAAARSALKASSTQLADDISGRILHSLAG